MESTEKAFDFAIELAKQLLTLSTAILTITAVFTQIIKAKTSGRTMLLRFAWIAYLVSIVSGVAHMMALTGTVARPPSGRLSAADLYGMNIVIPASVQVITFVIATALVISYGWRLPSADESEQATPGTSNARDQEGAKSLATG